MTDANVDMLAEAREAQWTALSFMGEDAIKVIAPAKVNLFLGIGGRRDDGYHEVVNAMHALALHDILFMTCRDTDGESADGDDVAYAGAEGSISVQIDSADKTQFLGAPGASRGGRIPVADNLIFKAIDTLARMSGRTSKQAVNVRVEKHIPMQAGLGGGSADAAAALVGMAHFWGIEDEGMLQGAAASLGADVAFFLKGGCAIYTGVGEVYDRSLTPMKHPVVIVKPDAGVSTPAAYKAFDEAPAAIPPELLAALDEADSAEEVPLFNNLAPAAESVLPENAEIREWLGAQDGVRSVDGASQVLLCGSGSSTFAICETYNDAARISAAANARGWWSRATSFSSLRALKV